MMKPYFETRLGKLYCGDALEVLKQLPDESVDVVITSPPYWAKRVYSGAEKIWRGDPNCEHEWVESPLPSTKLGREGHSDPKYKAANTDKPKPGMVCRKCGAVYTQLGLEPTPQMFVEHLVEIFREVKRVLKPTGSLFVNIDDTWAGGGAWNSGGGRSYKDNEWERAWAVEATVPAPVTYFKGVKERSLCLVPELFAIKMVYEEGWVLREKIIWCLSGDTMMYAKVDGKYWFGELRELYKFFKEGKMIEVPTLDAKFNPTWVKIINFEYTGQQKVKKIVLTNGLHIRATENHIFPTRATAFQSRNPKYLQLTFKKVSELKKGDFLHIVARLPCDLPEGPEKDYYEGLFVGFYLAEGNLLRTGNASTYNVVQLSCGEKDMPLVRLLEEKLRLKGNHTRCKNTIYVRYYRRRNPHIHRLVTKYVVGKTSKDKALTNDALNKSIKFLRGVLLGFLLGDGTYDKVGKRWRVGLTAENKLLAQQIQLIAKILGYEVRVQKDHSVKVAGKTYKVQKFTIKSYGVLYKNKGRIVNFNLVAQRIREIVDDGIVDTYDVEVEAPKVARYNRPDYNSLFFVGNGIWTHNSKKVHIYKDRTTIGNAMPESTKNRFAHTWEYIFHFTKIPSKYYFNLDAVRVPLKAETIARAQRGVESWKLDGTAKGMTIESKKKWQEKVLQAVSGGIVNSKYLTEEAQNTRSPGGRLAKIIAEGKIDQVTLVREAITNVNAYLKQKLKEKGLSVKKLAEMTGIRETQLAHYFRTDLSGAALPPREVWDTLKPILDLDDYENHIKEEYRSVIPSPHPLGANPGDVVQINVKPFKDAHFAVFPPDLPELLIKAACPEDGTVLDPFAGAGTTLIVAEKMGRRWVGIEISPDYCEIIKRRFEREVGGLMRMARITEFLNGYVRGS